MKALHRKLLRDLWQIRGQATAISLVIAAGVATFVMSLSTLESLQRSKDAYYAHYRFADVFVRLKRAPNTLKPRIAEIPGVADVQTRVVVDVTLNVAGLQEPAVGRLISTSDRAGELNAPHLRRGRFFEPRRTGEVVVSEAFAEAHGFQPGDSVSAVINGRYQKLTIVGVAISPEYLIQLQGNTLLPDDRRFGVFWMGYPSLAAAYDMDGAFNSVTLTLRHGASSDDVIKRLDDLLEPYGGVGAFPRSEQISNQYISDEIRQLRSMGLVAPSIFLCVAAFLLNVVLSRIINTQREQIAALKAFGYSRTEVGLHYLQLVLLIALAGFVLGTAAGTWFGQGLTRMYTQFYRFPVFEYHFDPGVASLALLISITAASAGTWTSVRRAVALPPAEAMRPEPPARYRPTIVERVGLGKWLPSVAKMILRNLERSPIKAALSSLGISMGLAVLVLGNFMEDSLDYLIDFQFYVSQRQDISLGLVEPSSRSALSGIQHLPGVRKSEPFRAVATRMRFQHRSRRVGIMGLSSDAQLYRLMDADERPVRLPSEGLVLSDKLAELLEVRLGDTITVEVLEGERPVRKIPVTGLVREYGGINSYMDKAALHRLLGEGQTVTGAFVSVDANSLDQLYRTLKQTPRVSSVSVKSAALQSFEDTVAENLMRMRAFNVMFASIIAFGVVYNSARISLSERSRELATLRVMGFTRFEISAILLGELAVLTIAAIPLGCGLGYLFGRLAALGVDTELYRIPLVIDLSTYGIAVTVILVAALVSGLVVRRRLDHLDLVAVLKTRE